MKTEAGWKLWTRKPSAAPAMIAARTPRVRALSRSKAIDRERRRRDRADAGREAVDAVGEVDDVHDQHDPDDRQRRAEVAEVDAVARTAA